MSTASGFKKRTQKVASALTEEEIVRKTEELAAAANKTPAELAETKKEVKVVEKKKLGRKPRKVATDHKNAPRNFKGMSIKFNQFEYNNLLKAAEEMEVDMMELIRAGIQKYTHPKTSKNKEKESK